MLSKACEYGLKAVICLSVPKTGEERKSISDISERIGSPEAYTSKILQRLVRAGIVQSSRGKYGGFYIDDSRLETLSLWDVVRVLDGESISQRCLLGLENCSNQDPCPVHETYREIRAKLVAFLAGTSIKELSGKVLRGGSVLKLKDLIEN